MKQQSFFLFSVLLVLLFGACNPVYQTESAIYSNYRISSGNAKDAAVVTLLQPYADSVNKSMNDVIGVNELNLEKKQPEGSLGNFMADALLYTARQKFNTNVDVAAVNFGGVRLTQLPAGNITRGKIYELMPFDNLLVLQQMKGAVLQQFLDHTAMRGGWPLAGVTFQIKEKKAVNVLVGGKPLNPAADYVMANSDYVANGGDESNVLKTIPQQNIGYLMRDALIDYVVSQTRQGKTIAVKEENRITNAQ
jgi:2',3'-cyclic-nucleotide 2'-phosphodiesterase (5'-nucleotidase family)